MLIILQEAMMLLQYQSAAILLPKHIMENYHELP